MMRAGRMDREIVIQRATTSETVVGSPVPTWTTHLTVWAEYIPVSGREFLQMNREVAALTARFIIRWNSDVLETDRISFGGRTWDILSLREIGRQEGLEITAEVRT